jgi:hypothetical protein
MVYAPLHIGYLGLKRIDGRLAEMTPSIEPWFLLAIPRRCVFTLASIWKNANSQKCVALTRRFDGTI